MKRSWLEVDLRNLEHNYKIVKNIVEEKEVLGVVKANAYGCGVIEISKALIEMGVKILGVACYQEAKELRDAGITNEILIMGAIGRDQYEEVFENDIQIAISCYDEIKYIENNNFKNPKVHIKIDTGMGRIGFLNDSIKEILIHKTKLKKMQIVGVFIHFSCADILGEEQYTEMQISKFKFYEELKEIKYIHSQNSGGILRFNKKCGGNLVRPGIMLYGFTDMNLRLKPICKLKSKIVHYKIMEEDSYISYGREGFVKKGDIVATIAIGYGDGYPRRFSNCGIMSVEGEPCQVLGKVCMDTTMIKIPQKLKDKIKLEMEVDVLYGDIFEQFHKAKVSPYEYLVGITTRAERIYIKGGKK